MGKKINKCALLFAVAQAFSIGYSLSNDVTDFKFKPKSSEEYRLLQNNIVATTQNGTKYYLRLDQKTGAFRAISIFDDENVKSKQYGANQMDFYTQFNELIKNPLIWNELQRNYPVSDFSSEKEAIQFYKLFFESISDKGCGYAVATNYIFKMFEGKEKEFEKTFGFPMYTVDNSLNIDFNYEIMMLKFMNYSFANRTYKPISKETLYSGYAKDLAEFRLNEYMNSYEYKSNGPNNYTRWNQLYKQWENSENQDVVIGVPLEQQFGKVCEFLERYGVKITSIYSDNIAKTFSLYDIVASDNFNLYGCEDGERKTDVKSHYVFVTGFEGEDKLIVSSWGSKYYFDNSNANWTYKLALKQK